MEIANIVYSILGIWIALILIHGFYRAGIEIGIEKGRLYNPMITGLSNMKDIINKSNFETELMKMNPNKIVLGSVSLMPGEPKIIKTERTAEQFKQCASCIFDWLNMNHKITEKDGYCYMFEKFNSDCSLYIRLNKHGEQR